MKDSRDDCAERAVRFVMRAREKHSDPPQYLRWISHGEPDTSAQLLEAMASEVTDIVVELVLS